ncbi:MAG: hypothetical protein AAF360_13470 [Pseudomonadota bacterium]
MSQLKVASGVNLPGAYDDFFAESRANVFETGRPERSKDLLRPYWRLTTSVDPNVELMRIGAYVRDQDDALCGGKDYVVNVSPKAATFLRLLVDTSNGDWLLLSSGKHPRSLTSTYSAKAGRGGESFGFMNGCHRMQIFNGLLDGDASHNDAAESV